MRTQLFIVPIILSVLISCEEEIATPGTGDFQPVLVVDGTFTDEPKIQSIKLTTSTKVNDDEAPLPAIGATVTVSDGVNMFIMKEEVANSGVYQTAESVSGVAGRTYLLTVIYEGQTYTASDRMMPASPAEPLIITALANGFYEWIVPNNHSLEPGTTYEREVSIVHQNGSADQVVYYNFTGLETSELFALNQMSRNFHFLAGERLIQRKLSLSPEFYEFLKAVYTETKWKGDLYDVTPANAPTNLSNGAQGYFRACAVTSTEQLAK